MALEPEPFLSAPVVTPPPLGSLTENQLGGLDYCGPGEYTTEGITKLCEALMSSAVTSLECAATPSEPVMFAFVPAPVDTTPSLHSTTQPVGKQPRSRRRSRSRGGSQGQLDAAIAQVSRLALELALKCLPSCQRPLTHLLSHLCTLCSSFDSLKKNDLAVEDKQALKDAAGSSIRIKIF